MKKQLTCLLAGMICLSGVFAGTAGCAAEKKSESNEEIVLADFEQWAPDFQILRPMSKFGAINVNTNAQYIKSGNQSAKLQPKGGTVSKSEPYVYICTSSETFEYDYSDFSGVTSLSAWMYNAQETIKTVEVGLITKINSIESADKLKGGVYSLMPGWNKIVYYPDLSLINLSADITDIKGVYFGFENAGTEKLKDAPVFYLDEVKMLRQLDPDPISDIVELDAGEILDFEKDYQANVVTPDITYSSAKSAPEIAVVRASDYGITASSGEKVLRVVTHCGENYLSAWPKFSISEKIIKKSGFMNIPKEEWSNYRFAFDVYSETKDGFVFYPELYTSSNVRYNTNFAVTAGRWITITESFTEHNFPGWTDEIIKSPGAWKIAWDEYKENQDYVFYFDNFRYEKINK